MISFFLAKKCHEKVRADQNNQIRFPLTPGQFGHVEKSQLLGKG